MQSDPRAKLLTLLEALRDLEEKRSAIYAEMDTLLKGGDGIGEKLKRAKAFWCATWQERHKEPFDFDHGKHTAWLKIKITKHGEEVVTAKIYSFIMGEDQAAFRARHPFGWFMQGYNTYRGLPATAEPETETTDRLRAARGE